MQPRRPSIDGWTAHRVCRPGDTTAISAVRGNVHWFRGLTDSWALVVAYDLDPAAGGTATTSIRSPASGNATDHGGYRG